MGSSKSKGRKNQRTHKPSAQPTPRKQAPQPVKKERGGWLIAILVFILIHAVFSAILLLIYHKDPGPAKPWLLAAALIISLAEIVAVVALWYWKKWGLYLYVVAVLAGIGVGLVAYPSMLVAFHGIVPVALLGYVLSYQKKLALLE
jgi:hypothetical protein